MGFLSDHCENMFHQLEVLTQAVGRQSLTMQEILRDEIRAQFPSSEEPVF